MRSSFDRMKEERKGMKNMYYFLGPHWDTSEQLSKMLKSRLSRSNNNLKRIKPQKHLYTSIGENKLKITLNKKNNRITLGIDYYLIYRTYFS